MFRSEQEPGTPSDIYHYRASDDYNYNTELTIHATNSGDDVSSVFLIGVSSSYRDGIHWVMIKNNDLDDLITALQYAKAISENPNLREK